MNRHFILAAFADAVGDELPIIGQSVEIHAGGVVGAQRSRINEHLFRSRSSPHVKDKQILAGGALGIKIAAAAFAGKANRIHFDQFAQALGNRIASRQRFQQALRAGILRIDPRACFGAVLIFQPAVGIAHHDAVN